MLKSAFFITEKKDINLLPESLKKEIRLNKLLASLIGLFLAVFVFILVIYVTVLYMNEKLYERNSLLNFELDSEKYEVTEELYNTIGRIEAEIDSIDSRLMRIGNPHFVSENAFTSIIGLLPAGVDIQSISINSDQRKIILVGASDERQKITDFTDALYDTGEYESISLKNLSSTSEGIIFFTIEF